MHSSILALLGALAAFILYQIISALLLWRHNAIKAKELGCKRAPALMASDPFGYMNVRDMLKADAEKRMPDFQIERVNEISQKLGRVAHTFEVKMPPGKVISILRVVVPCQ
jgi:hypothetical protein